MNILGADEPVRPFSRSTYKSDTFPRKTRLSPRALRRYNIPIR